MQTLETKKYRGFDIKISQDDMAESPREWDNVGIIAYKHSRYVLGEEQIDDPIDWLEEKLGLESKEEYSNERLEELEEQFYESYVAEPLYVYEHGGVSISTSPFNCRWDSGKVGYIYTTKERLKEMGIDIKSRLSKKECLDTLKNEVKLYDAFSKGDVYYFSIENNGEIIESMGCFYGYDMEKNCLLEEARYSIDNYIKSEIDNHVKKLKGKIKNKVNILLREPFQLKIS